MTTNEKFVELQIEIFEDIEEESKKENKKEDSGVTVIDMNNDDNDLSFDI